jgi:hypothetical protein
VSVVIATVQPLPTASRRSESGIRTFSKNTSLKPASPVILISGFTVTPGWPSIGHRK